MPKQRKLTTDEANGTATMLTMKANKKLLQNHIMTSSMKPVRLKDLHNLASSVQSGSSNFKELLQEMRKVKGASIELLTDNSDTVQGIYFQTGEMKKTFAAYPELLLIDATYKLNNLRMPLYVLMSVDGNGDSEVVCLWMLAQEDQESIAFMMDKFKHHNTKAGAVKVVMADKDLTERKVLMDKLPDATIMICLFHTLRSFRREVSTEKLGISVGERQMSLEVLNKMAYAKSESEYDALYQQLCRDCPRSVVTYFNDNWHNIRSEWVEGFKNMHSNFLNMTNNRLEATNQKLKSVVTRGSNMTVFFQDLMKCIRSLKIERNHHAVDAIAKVPNFAQVQSSVQMDYCKLLTPYAYGYLKQQLDLMRKIRIVRALDDRSAKVKISSLGEKVVGVDSCHCSFFTSMQLPCRHIFAVRLSKDLPVYDASLCPERWTLAYYYKNHRVYMDDTRSEHQEQQNECDVTVHSTANHSQRKAVLSEQQKYKKAFTVCQSIAQIMSQFGMRDFKRNMDVLMDMQKCLSARKTVNVVEIDGDIVDGVPCPTPTPMASSSQEQPSTDTPTVNSDIVDGVPCPTPTPMASSSQEQPSTDTPTVNSDIVDGVPCPTPTPMASSSQGQPSTDTPTVNSDIVDGVPCPTPTPMASSSQGQPFNTDSLPLNNITSQMNCQLKFPPTMKKRGRPKGAGLTCIGLPAKRACRSVSGNRKRPVPFLLKSANDKQRIILKWFVVTKVAEEAISRGRIIQENEVESIPEKVPMECLDENVAINTVRKFFSYDAWILVTQVLKVLKTKGVWLCSTCNDELAKSTSVCCEACLSWFHIKCIGLNDPPKKKNWFCRGCNSNE
ncbi:uncharacterized protein LOC119733644 [Patiria miniata]|uniref:Uncharacterized protein n=1 Tax=Patiria miniata TaxID=46514 RepID=A0A914AG72_PATMI|nr:uncharacterized protein LOC119733644 [Patiria miniata]